MPLVRVEVRNEYSLGAVELYRDVNKDDPKEVLEGVTVAGLVGVLRQLGDLADFAAEVFHGLQEDVAVTSSRSRKLLTRVQRIEAAVSPLEKAILAQRSHLHFAYTSGSNWRTRIRSQENHFMYSEMPQFIMESYEGSRSPPRLELLDKFDPGGPGSCLKRYSDPTFFKRASVASGERHVEKIAKYHDRKIKKRRSWPRSGRVSRDASFSYHSGRTQFTQLNNGVHTPPSRTMSTYEATPTSEFGERSNLYSRNGSDYIEADSRPSYSKQPDEQESRESITSSLKRHDNDFLDYTFLEEKVVNGYDDPHISSSQEHAGCSSSSGTWDVKTETLEPTIIPSNYGGMSETAYPDEKSVVQEPTTYCVNDGITEEDLDANLEQPSPNLDLESLTDKAGDFDTVNKVYLQPNNKVVSEPKSDDGKLEDIESEPENFMDALNMIESESETDADCMKKQVDHSPMLEREGVCEGLQECMESNVACQDPISNSEVLSNTLPLHSQSEGGPISQTENPSYAAKSSSVGAGKDEFEPMHLVDEPVQLTETAREFSNLSIPRGVTSHENGSNADHTEVYHEDGNVDTETNSSSRNGKPDDDGTNAEPVSGTMSSSNYENNMSGQPILDGIMANPESVRNVPQTSNSSSFTFWTNGGLLGLQPSKPPEHSLPNSHRTNNGESSLSNQRYEGTEKPDPAAILKSIEGGHDSESSTSSEYQKSGASFRKLSWKISPSDLDIKSGIFGSSLYANNTSTAHSAAASGNFLSSNSTSLADHKAKENANSTSGLFKLGNRFLASGSNKKLLAGGDGNSIPSGHPQTSVEKKNYPNFQNQASIGRSKFQFSGESPMLSPSASPPLEHMKISFQPIVGLETSKLKLKFPDGNADYGGNMNDLFPSFQLVPEASIAPHDVGSDSDDDTFYRSSPSLSDGHHSFRSESNSEQWESGESSTSKDHDLYDALRRVSLSESVSTTVPESEKTRNIEGFHESHGLQFPSVENGIQNSQYCGSFDRQSLDTLNHSFREEATISSNSKDVIETQFGSAQSPAPPPMPPIQWRDMKPSLEVTENKCTPTEGFSSSFDHKLSGSKISQKLKPAPANHIQISEAVNMQKNKKLNSQVSNREGELSLGRRADDNDFLHQIRTKSFNLRPTVTSKPVVPSTNSSANVQVTEILKRATAIRQAVGSDDGEEDSNWSDA